MSGSENLTIGMGGIVTIVQPGTVAELTCAPSNISPPDSASCVVSLTAAAPSGGTIVTLGYVSSGATIFLPSSVLASEGTTQQSFSMHAVSASSSTTATITATLNDITKTYSLGVTPEIQPPAAPANPTATAVSTSQINLFWNASTDNIAVMGYLLERCQGSTCTNFAQIATPTGTSYHDTGLAANTAYRYQVRARDAAGNQSAYSAIVSATTQVETSVSVAPATASLSASQAQQFTATVAGSVNTAVTWTWSPGVGIISGTGSYIAPPSISTQQTVTVTATSVADSTKSASATITLLATPGPDTTPPAAPGNASATSVSTSQINISWNPATDNVGVTEYRVERCQGRWAHGLCPGCLSGIVDSSIQRHGVGGRRPLQLPDPCS